MRLPAVPPLAVMMVLTAASLAAAPAAAKEQAGVLVLAVDDITRPYLRLINDEFRDVVLAAPDAPAVYFESLDASRFGTGDDEMFRRWLAEKYEGRRIDVVVALGEDALGFLAAGHGEPWPRATVLYLESGGVAAGYVKALPRTTGLLLHDFFPAALELVRRILPGTRRVALVYGAAPLDERRWGGYASTVRAAGLEPIVIGGVPLEQMLATVSRLPDDAVAFILSPMVDSRGRVFGPRPCEAFAAAASVPSFTPAAHDLGCGVVGGLMRDWRAVGRLLGKRVLALVRARGPVDAVVDVPLDEYTMLAFDERQVARWRIEKSRLPPGSVILFAPPSFWADHRRQILTTIAVLALAAALGAAVLMERRRRRKAEIAARQHLAVAAHLDRRATMGELATSLAHELSQPLNSILQNAGVAQMLLATGDTAPGAQELKEIIADIRSDDLRASEVIKRMRSLLQKRELELAPLDPNALARDTVALVRADAHARDVRLELGLAEQAGPVRGDRVHLQQVLLNLLLNAVEAAMQVPPAQRLILVRTAQHNGETRVAVEDRGPGIRAQRLPDIFEPFYTTKGDGMGMGLAIARGIVEAHGGRIAAENNDAGGATVWFSVPTMKGHAP